MKVKVIEDAVILIPNKDHKNFTETGRMYPKGTELEGEEIQVKGLRRGEDFTYRLFKTNNKQLIFLNKTDMKNRVVKLGSSFDGVAPEEIKLGFDGVEPIIIDEDPNKSIFSVYTSVGILVGSGIGFGIAKYKNQSVGRMVAATLIGAVAGYFIGKQIQKRIPIVVKR